MTGPCRCAGVPRRRRPLVTRCLNGKNLDRRQFAQAAIVPCEGVAVNREGPEG
ncbi:hypothetical protein NK6_7821 [Bradyrhizobium diazoefficiens]|uniref:Uncharacterized protein n=1 Tax=Bradyrhizobium diazoefficiens TaxID=1355477 RepID=A0A0E4FXG2_9BRAD|nr:hypothetical protein NK6_7821 [Bradyrhizobium diazoefficiens]